jgi:predicted enzyme related to lactoylglutathione lyase
MKVETYEEGTPCWIGLGTDKAAVAADFYGGLFDWICPEGPPEHSGFRTCLLGGVPVSGMGATRGNAPQGWRTYFSVADLEVTIERAVRAGGSVILPATDVATAGRLAVLADPMGVPFGLWEPLSFQGISIIDTHGSLAWCELITDDVAQSRRFYGEVFGWTVSDPSPDDPYKRADWLLNGRAIAGIMPRPPSMPSEMKPYWDVYFQTEDLGKTVATARTLGAQVLLESMENHHGRFGVFLDPVGSIFSVIQRG